MRKAPPLPQFGSLALGLLDYAFQGDIIHTSDISSPLHRVPVSLFHSGLFEAAGLRVVRLLAVYLQSVPLSFSVLYFSPLPMSDARVVRHVPASHACQPLSSCWALFRFPSLPRHSFSPPPSWSALSSHSLNFLINVDFPLPALIPVFFPRSSLFQVYGSSPAHSPSSEPKRPVPAFKL